LNVYIVRLETYTYLSSGLGMCIKVHQQFDKELLAFMSGWYSRGNINQDRPEVILESSRILKFFDFGVESSDRIGRLGHELIGILVRQ
jgi:hypothetical protein